ncbi:NADPH:quinone oxidoreductase [Cryptomeria japonica]|uniref:NADPH:quinone oxidoreductase n=1 Tax=Cryptomeria japonica TaxID=3369 RepID=UPI0025ABBF94|nr:NADPH:quinone oxidoreductase [Cryptomeria japonica]
MNMLRTTAVSAGLFQKCPNPYKRQIIKFNYRRSKSMSTMASADSLPEHVMKVAAISGSLRKSSFNRGLLRSAVEIARESIPHMEIDILEIGHLPFVNTDLEVDNRFPPSVEEFRAKVLQADCILFASPEYNYSVSSPLKNAIDWASRPPNAWADKPAAIMSAGGGFGGALAQNHLRQIGIYIDLHFINKPELRIRAFEHPTKFDGDGNLVDDQIRKEVKELLLSLSAFTRRLQNKEVPS